MASTHAQCDVTSDGFVVQYKNKKKMFSILIETCLTLISLVNVEAVIELSDTPHKTTGAKSSRIELSCYICDTMVEGERCSNLSLGNRTNLIRKCEDNDRTQMQCMVKRFSYTTSNENSTSVLRLWALQRNCSSRCEPGCIIIGERTKLYSCISCCNSNVCNTGKAKSSRIFSNVLLLILAFFI